MKKYEISYGNTLQYEKRMIPCWSYVLKRRTSNKEKKCEMAMCKLLKEEHVGQRDEKHTKSFFEEWIYYRVLNRRWI